jgi:hypothetical protein
MFPELRTKPISDMTKSKLDFMAGVNWKVEGSERFSKEKHYEGSLDTTYLEVVFRRNDGKLFRCDICEEFGENTYF